MYNPLISIVVVSYLSQDTILETLDSIKNQTYRNLEVIITDDNSSDDTLRIAKQWSLDNSGLFVNIEIVSTKTNTGVSCNCNRGASVARGEWIKFIDADDLLLPNAIEDIVACIEQNPQFDIIYSKVELFGDGDINRFSKLFNNHLFTLKGNQHKYKILTTNFITSASVTINKQFFYEIGMFDENIPFMEDWPFWIKCAMTHSSIGFYNHVTASYRVNIQSLSNGNKSVTYLQNERKLREYSQACQKEFSYLLYLLSYTIEKSKSNKFYKPLIYINPVFYYLKYLDFKARRNSLDSIFYEINQ